MSISLEDRSILYVSASYEQVMGYPIERSGAGSRIFKQVVHPDDLAMTLEKRHQATEEWPISSTASFCPMAGSAGCTGVRGCSTTARAAGGRQRQCARHYTAKRGGGSLARQRGDVSIPGGKLGFDNLLIDADGRYLYLNTIAAMPFGGDPDALVGKSVYDLFPAQEADDVLADVQWVIQSEKGMVLEPQVTIGDRTCWFRTSIQPVRDSDGVPYAALLHASDITERKLVEQEIHRQNAILQQSHDLIALSDLDGVITYINQGGADMAEVGDPQPGSRAQVDRSPSTRRRLPHHV
ncbi:MAG: PAS domain-containing protein [Caldilineaceae bacterium]